MSGPHDYHTPKSSYSKEDLLESGKGGYFGPGNAQLPAPPMLRVPTLIFEMSLRCRRSVPISGPATPAMKATGGA